MEIRIQSNIQLPFLQGNTERDPTTLPPRKIGRASPLCPSLCLPDSSRQGPTSLCGSYGRHLATPALEVSCSGVSLHLPLHSHTDS